MFALTAVAAAGTHFCRLLAPVLQYPLRVPGWWGMGGTAVKRGIFGIFFLMASSLVSGCGGSQPSAAPGAAPKTNDVAQQPLVKQEDAVGWSTLHFDKTNGANSDFSYLGHYKTSWVYCSRQSPDDSVISDVHLLNRVIVQMNKAVTLPALPKDKLLCLPAPTPIEVNHRSMTMDGNVTYKYIPSDAVDESKLPQLILFEQGFVGEVCTSIPDRQLAIELLGNLNHVVAIMGQTGC